MWPLKEFKRSYSSLVYLLHTFFLSYFDKDIAFFHTINIFCCILCSQQQAGNFCSSFMTCYHIRTLSVNVGEFGELVFDRYILLRFLNFSCVTAIMWNGKVNGIDIRCDVFFNWWLEIVEYNKSVDWIWDHRFKRNIHCSTREFICFYLH